MVSLSVGKELFLNKDESKSVTCSAKSYPIPTIVWTNDDSKPFRTCQKSATCTLTIEHISAEERRNYVCTASTEFGTASVSFVAIGTGKYLDKFNHC